MKIANLYRTTKSTYGPTKGVFFIEGAPVMCTLELPWLNNKKRMSCIPIGVYRVERCKVPRYNLAYRPIASPWEVMDVPGRVGILIHTGNYMSETMGCILTGTYFENDAVRNSIAAKARMEEIIGADEEFVLHVEYMPGLIL